MSYSLRKCGHEITKSYHSSSALWGGLSLYYSVFNRIIFGLRKKQGSFSIAIGNVKLMHQGYPQHLRVGTRVKKYKEGKLRNKYLKHSGHEIKKFRLPNYSMGLPIFKFVFDNSSE